MRVLGNVLQVFIRSTGRHGYLPEFHHDGVCYVVGTPDQLYSVEIRKTQTLLHCDATHLRVALQIDGRDVGYTKLVPLAAVTSFSFDGFLASGGSRLSTPAFRYQSFQFATPAAGLEHTAAITLLGDDDFCGTVHLRNPVPLGTIRVVVWAVRQCGKQEGDEYIASVQDSAATCLGAAPSKPCFQGPSLATTSGKTLKRPNNFTACRYEQVGPILADVVLHYETLEVLTARGIVKSADPAQLSPAVRKEHPGTLRRLSDWFQLRRLRRERHSTLCDAA